MLRVGVPRETAPQENRVALIPEVAGRLVKAGLEVSIETGAGVAASYADADYAAAGAKIAADPREAFSSDVVLKVREPMALAGGHEVDLLREGAVLIAFLNPSRNPELIDRLVARQVSAFAMELIPRTTRAQKMDALSSMSTVAGYKAVLMAATTLGKFFPLLMTAAGTIAPARVFVLGAGVAGLQAIATSRRLGAVVEAFDVRPAVREEVQSLGATFVALDLADEKMVGEGGYAKAMSAEQEAKERELIHRHVQTSDVVISTAMVPGKKAPLLITEAMVRDMRPGSVIVDLAAETGGNCELTRPGEIALAHGVTIHGPLNLAATLPVHASQMYSRNVSALLMNMVKQGALVFDFEDEITRDTCVSHQGKPMKGSGRAAPNAPPAAPAPATGVPASPVASKVAT
jgi:NAD(P) transhydrogenase subunit alpha